MALIPKRTHAPMWAALDAHLIAPTMLIIIAKESGGLRHLFSMHMGAREGGDDLARMHAIAARVPNCVAELVRVFKDFARERLDSIVQARYTALRALPPSLSGAADVDNSSDDADSSPLSAIDPALIAAIDADLKALPAA